MPGGQPGYSTPRWVKAFGISTLIMALLIIVVMVFAGGNHGPGRHLPGGSGLTGPNASDGAEVRVTADRFAFEPARLVVPAGAEVAIVLTAVDLAHTFTVDVLDAHVAADRGESATGGLLAGQTGRFTFYCSEPGHRQAGMQGVLIVEAAER
jgi:plastocyanin